jgi:hypothetical protein
LVAAVEVVSPISYREISIRHSKAGAAAVAAAAAVRLPVGRVFLSMAAPATPTELVALAESVALASLRKSRVRALAAAMAAPAALLMAPALAAPAAVAGAGVMARAFLHQGPLPLAPLSPAGAAVVAALAVASEPAVVAAAARSW